MGDAHIIDFFTDVFGFRPLEAFVAWVVTDDTSELTGLSSTIPARRGKTWLTKLSTHVLETAMEVPAVKTVILLRYTSDLFGDGPHPVGHDVARAVCKRLHEAGYSFLAFVVAVDGWGEYRFDDAAEVEFEQRPLDELRAYPIRPLSALRAGPSRGR